MVPAKCKSSVYVLIEICLQWSKRLGPKSNEYRSVYHYRKYDWDADVCMYMYAAEIKKNFFYGMV